MLLAGEVRRRLNPLLDLRPQGPRLDWTLFFSALASSTLLPGSSEALLLLKLKQGGDAALLVVSATIGNLLGSLLTYALGRAGNLAAHRHWLRFEARDLERAEQWFARWGRPVLLFAWLPIVGDPLCLAAGLLRIGWISFLLLTGIGKLARYLLLAGMVP